jgi:hypothetical protein
MIKRAPEQQPIVANDLHWPKPCVDEAPPSAACNDVGSGGEFLKRPDQRIQTLRPIRHPTRIPDEILGYNNRGAFR